MQRVHLSSHLMSYLKTSSNRQSRLVLVQLTIKRQKVTRNDQIQEVACNQSNVSNE